MSRTARAPGGRHDEASPGAGSWQIGSAADGWWSRERSVFLTERLRPTIVTAGRALDSGCGRGTFSRQMALLAGGLTVACDAERYEEWRNEPGRLAHVVCDAARLPFRSGAFDVAVALDVIEHFADDRGPLSELRRVAAPTGHVGLTVPAFPELWSAFDDNVGHHRRYRAGDLTRVCQGTGLQPVDQTYFFSWLVPPAWILRKRDRRDADRSTTGLAGRVVNRGVGLICRVERSCLRRWRLPFGTSLWSLNRIASTQ